MTIITSHILNGTDGTHASGIKVIFSELCSGKIFEDNTDDYGRIKKNIESAKLDSFVYYELVFETGPYWIERGYRQIMDQVVLRFKIPDLKKDFHIPIIISPNSYSVWWSS